MSRESFRSTFFALSTYSPKLELAPDRADKKIEPLLPSENAQFSAIIDGILASADLETISAKQIMRELQAKLGIDVSEKKDAVKALIMNRFDYASAPPAPKSPQLKAEPHTNGHSTPTSKPKTTPKTKVKAESPSSDPDASDSDASPPKKKQKQSKETDDAKLAAMLQAQENRNIRATRGGGSAKKKAPVKKRTPKKKSADKVKADDDSELEVGSDGEIKEKPKKGGFHKQYHLSAPLADLVGESTLSRPQVVKKIWDYIKARDLQVPEDKRQIRCDDKMQLVFKQDKVHMFTMNKALGKQLYDIEE